MATAHTLNGEKGLKTVQPPLKESNNANVFVVFTTNEGKFREKNKHIGTSANISILTQEKSSFCEYQ